MIQVNRIYLIFNRLVTKKFLVDTSDSNLRKTMNAYDLPESPKTLLVSSSIQPIYFEIH
ncbi:Uncharacterised protein [Bacteroides uniformis]|nr:Uncharacterised protein [Bacteroides uniformis]